MAAVVGILAILVAIAGVVLVVLQLPGGWVIVAAALLARLLEPEMVAWLAVGATFGLAVVGELVEFLAGSHGAKKAGGGRAAAIGAMVGSLLGAVAGTLVVPFLGTLLGAIMGAGVGAVVGERGITGSSWKKSAQVAGGAAMARWIATIVKVSLAAAAALVLFADIAFL